MPKSSQHQHVTTSPPAEKSLVGTGNLRMTPDVPESELDWRENNSRDRRLVARTDHIMFALYLFIAAILAAAVIFWLRR